MSEIKVLMLLGSLRASSINRQLAELGAESAPDGVRLQLFDRLGELPLYNEDTDNDQVAEPVIALREAAAAADAALVVTPENNGSIPAVLKNAIDWLSRPFGQSALADKPVAVIGAAAGHTGGAQAHDETRRSFNSFGKGPPKVVETSSCRYRSSRWTVNIHENMPTSRRTCAASSLSWPPKSPVNGHADCRRAGLSRPSGGFAVIWSRPTTAATLSVPGGKQEHDGRHALDVTCDTPMRRITMSLRPGNFTNVV